MPDVARNVVRMSQDLFVPGYSTRRRYHVPAQCCISAPNPSKVIPARKADIYQCQSPLRNECTFMTTVSPDHVSNRIFRPITPPVSSEANGIPCLESMRCAMRTLSSPIEDVVSNEGRAPPYTCAASCCVGHPKSCMSESIALIATFPKQAVGWLFLPGVGNR